MPKMNSVRGMHNSAQMVSADFLLNVNFVHKVISVEIRRAPYLQGNDYNAV